MAQKPLSDEEMRRHLELRQFIKPERLLDSGPAIVKIQHGADIHELPPVPNNEVAVWELVVQDMLKRDMMGAQKYGVRLQPRNGRDALWDAYQEALDLVVYLRQAIWERDNPLKGGSNDAPINSNQPKEEESSEDEYAGHNYSDKDE